MNLFMSDYRSHQNSGGPDMGYKGQSHSFSGWHPGKVLRDLNSKSVKEESSLISIQVFSAHIISNNFIKMSFLIVCRKNSQTK